MEPILLTEPVRTAGLAQTIADVFDTMRALFTGAIEWTGSMVTVVTTNPIVLAAVLIALVGTGVGLLNRVKSL